MRQEQPPLLARVVALAVVEPPIVPIPEIPPVAAAPGSDCTSTGSPAACRQSASPDCSASGSVSARLGTTAAGSDTAPRVDYTSCSSRSGPSAGRYRAAAARAPAAAPPGATARATAACTAASPARAATAHAIASCAAAGRATAAATPVATAASTHAPSRTRRISSRSVDDPRITHARAGSDCQQ